MPEYERELLERRGRLGAHVQLDWFIEAQSPGQNTVWGLGEALRGCTLEPATGFTARRQHLYHPS